MPIASAATWVEFTFDGTVVDRFGDNSDHPWNGVQIGDSMSFSYVIDIDQPDQNNSPTSGQYDVASAALTFGGVTLVPETVLPLQVTLSGSLGFDEVVIAMEPFGQAPEDAAFFRLYGFNNLPDDGIPIDFDLEEFGLRNVTYGGGGVAVQGVFDSYSYQIVPAPGALIALAAFIFRTGSRRRSGRH
jgi:hypothetical protein